MDQAVQPELDLDTVMTRRFELCDEVDTAVRQHKADLAPITEELEMCETFIKKTMLESKTQQHRSATTGHETHFVTKTKCTVSDMDAVIDLVLKTAPSPVELGISDPVMWGQILRHIQVNGFWPLLTNAVSKEAAKEYVKTNNAPPPGVKFSEYRDLAWSRGKS
jgi:hypothetical protein